MSVLNESRNLNSNEMVVYNAIDSYLSSKQYYNLTKSEGDKLNKSRAFTIWFLLNKWKNIFNDDVERAKSHTFDKKNDNKIDGLLALYTGNSNSTTCKHELYFIQTKYYTKTLDLAELRDIKTLISNVNDIDKNNIYEKSENPDLASKQGLIKKYLNYQNCEIHFVLLTTAMLENVQKRRWDAFVRGTNLHSLPRSSQNYDDDPITGEVKNLIAQLKQNHKSVSLDLVDLNELKRLGYVNIK